MAAFEEKRQLRHQKGYPQNRSVVSHQTLEEIAAADPSVPSRQKNLNQIRLHEALESADLQEAPVKPLPHGLTPMLATLVKAPFDHPDWLFEVKWDGYRALAEIRGGWQSIPLSRNQISLNKKFFRLPRRCRNLRLRRLWMGKSSWWMIRDVPISRCCRITKNPTAVICSTMSLISCSSPDMI